MVGRVIGRGGETIKGLQSQTGARSRSTRPPPRAPSPSRKPLLRRSGREGGHRRHQRGQPRPQRRQPAPAAAAAAQLYGHPGFGGHPGMHPGQFGGHPAAYGHMGAYGIPRVPGRRISGRLPTAVFAPAGAAQQQFAAQQMLFAGSGAGSGGAGAGAGAGAGEDDGRAVAGRGWVSGVHRGGSQGRGGAVQEGASVRRAETRAREAPRPRLPVPAFPAPRARRGAPVRRRGRCGGGPSGNPWTTVGAGPLLQLCHRRLHLGEAAVSERG